MTTLDAKLLTENIQPDLLQRKPYGTSNGKSQRYRSRDNTVDAFFAEVDLRSRELYPAHKTGRVAVGLDPDGAAKAATAHFIEHRPIGARKYQLSVTAGQRSFIELPAGGYTIVVHAVGLRPHRMFVDLSEDQTLDLNALLEEPAELLLNFYERAAALQIDTSRAGDVVVEEGTEMLLDGSYEPKGAQLHQINLRNVDEAKRMLGLSDDYFPQEQPRFGKMVASRPHTSIGNTDETNVPLDARFAMREYIYGNSTSVAGWKSVLNKYLADGVLIPIHLAITVTVGPHAVLTLNSAALSCYKLRVHYTGKVRVVGNGATTIDTDVYEQYGLMLSPAVPLQDAVRVNI